jgi:hypothetical protein
MLPKLEELRRNDSPLSFVEVSVVSKSLRSLACLNGFAFETAQVDISSLIFPCLETVVVESENDSDLQFIATILENSIPQLKILFLRKDAYTTDSSVDYVLLCTSLMKIIKVRFSLSNLKTSPGLNILTLSFDFLLQTANLDTSLDIICGLDQITTLYLLWNRMSLGKIKSALKKQGGMKQWEIVVLGRVDQEVNDSDILEICSYLPSLLEWTLFATRRATLTVEGVTEWKRICPNLKTVQFAGGGLPEEVNEVLKGLGVTVR